MHSRNCPEHFASASLTGPVLGNRGRRDELHSQITRAAQSQAKSCLYSCCCCAHSAFILHACLSHSLMGGSHVLREVDIQPGENGSLPWGFRLFFCKGVKSETPRNPFESIKRKALLGKQTPGGWRRGLALPAQLSQCEGGWALGSENGDFIYPPFSPLPPDVGAGGG